MLIHDIGPWCQCYKELLYHEDGELLELHVYICEKHMDMASQAIELALRGENMQLTLPLPSRSASGGEADANCTETYPKSSNLS